MAKKNKNRVILEDIELKPQVIGYTYKKKSNLGRVIIIFIAFLLVVIYINDISVFINGILGKNSASTIKDNTTNKKPNNQNNPSQDNQKLTYYELTNDLSITKGDLNLNNFRINGTTLNFDVVNNNSSKELDYTNRKLFIETYNANKTLLERFKIDVKKININAKISLALNLHNDFSYLSLTEKTADDYPNVNILKDEMGNGKITCAKDAENIVYTFLNDELTSINHTINDNKIEEEGYNNRYTSYQNKMATLNNIEGITATFNGTVNGFTAVIAIDLAKANLENLSENYYYGYKEKAKVIDFEMKTYGFNCN